MRALALLYHDVIPDGDFSASGFRGADADVYKMSRDDFARHLEALGDVRNDGAGSVWSLIDPEAANPIVRVEVTPGTRPPLLLTFDDGGATAFPVTTEMLDERGWTGHFFVTAGRIGTPGFVDETAIRGLRDAGHVVGSHSFSHPPRMSKLSKAELVTEWRQSAERLAEILGEPVRSASVPGGYYSRDVAMAASEAGIRVLFNSEPVSRLGRVGDTVVIGRYTLQRDASPAVAAALATDAGSPRLRQWSAWNARKLAKAVGGRHYIALKNAILRGRERRAAD